MVQLKAFAPGDLNSVAAFQFLYGTIKSTYPSGKAGEPLNFNSSMVQLKAESLEVLCTVEADFNSSMVQLKVMLFDQ